MFKKDEILEKDFEEFDREDFEEFKEKYQEVHSYKGDLEEIYTRGVDLIGILKGYLKLACQEDCVDARDEYSSRTLETIGRLEALSEKMRLTNEELKSRRGFFPLSLSIEGSIEEIRRRNRRVNIDFEPSDEIRVYMNQIHLNNLTENLIDSRIENYGASELKVKEIAKGDQGQFEIKDNGLETSYSSLPKDWDNLKFEERIVSKIADFYSLEVTFSPIENEDYNMLSEIDFTDRDE
ncbi:MAG: hypothetical protein ACLFQ8_00065 [Candidatus Aenigmatarchaeota archaeon]